jgi:hypothetical protein
MSDDLDSGVRALFLDCRASIDLALKAVELGAYPGPAWRKSAAETLKLIDRVTRAPKARKLP